MTAKPFAVIDAETDPFKFGRIPAPFVWGFFDGDNYEEFTDTESLCDFIANFDGIIYAHNGGKFDYHFLLDKIDPFADLMIINGRISKMNIGLAELRDSYNILPVPLSEYKKDDIDYSIMEASERHKPENRRKISAYLKTDCIYLYELISRFHDDYGIKLTRAGASMAHWKKIAPVEVPRTNADFYNEFYPYYFGGRVQCFEKGIIDANFSVFDINSAYPYAMLAKHPYSSNFSRHVGFKKGADFYRLLCVARGCFPLRDGGLTFPDDNERREYHVTQWEYQVALDTATISDVEILESIIFTGHMEFSAYVNEFYEMRNECNAKNDAAGSLLAKLAMNSLYGKFAANPQAYKHYQAWPMEHAGMMEDHGWHFAGELGDWALAAAGIETHMMHYYNVATGASITGYVRAMLWRVMHSAKRVLYCDTDSIACVSADLDTGPRLGQWKHEGNFDRAGIAGKKLYIFRGTGDTENKFASKGVRLTELQLWQVARGKTVTYNSDAPTFSVRNAPLFGTRKIQLTI